MIVLAITPFDSKRMKIRLDNGMDLPLYKGELRRLNLSEGDEITNDKFNMIMDEILSPRCKSRALHLLEKMDRTELNLRQKLKESGYPDVCIDFAVDYCKEYRYVDDEAYARNYIEYRQNSKSRSRIRQDLIGKGISSNIIDNLLDECFCADEDKQIIKLLEKRHYDSSNATFEERTKQFRYLASKGYSFDAINRCLGLMDE